jgi:hypothetical protein
MKHTDNFTKGFKAGLLRRHGRTALGSRAANDEFRTGKAAGFRFFRHLVNNAIANDRMADLHKLVAAVIRRIDAGDTRAMEV